MSKSKKVSIYLLFQGDEAKRLIESTLGTFQGDSATFRDTNTLYVSRTLSSSDDVDSDDVPRGPRVRAKGDISVAVHGLAKLQRPDIQLFRD